MKHSHRRQYQFEGETQFAQIFFTCKNVTKKGLMLMSVTKKKKKAKAQGSKIMIGFNKKS